MPGDVEGGEAGGDLVGEFEGEGLALVVRGDGGVEVTAGGVEARPLDGDVHAVERDRARRRVEPEVDRARCVEGAGGGPVHVRGDAEAIGGGADRGGQPEVLVEHDDRPFCVGRFAEGHRPGE